MIEAAEGLKEAGTIQVQAERYEGYTVLVNALIESAGTEILSGPEKVDLEQKPTEEALAVIGKLAHSSAAAPNLSTSNEDSARLAVRGGRIGIHDQLHLRLRQRQGRSARHQQRHGCGAVPAGQRQPGETAARRLQPRGQLLLGHKKEAFEAAACLSGEKSELTAVELDGLPPSHENLYTGKVVQKAYPGFAELVKESVEAAGPRPTTPAYQDVTSAIQRTLHPPDKIDPEDTEGIYEELKSNLEAAVKREGLL